MEMETMGRRSMAVKHQLAFSPNGQATYAVFPYKRQMWNAFSPLSCQRLLKVPLGSVCRDVPQPVWQSYVRMSNLK